MERAPTTSDVRTVPVQASEDWAATVLAASPDAVFALDGEGRVLEMNAAAERLVGTPVASARGRPLAALLGARATPVLVPLAGAGPARQAAFVRAVDEAGRHAQILDSVPDMVFTKDARSTVTYANRATSEYYGKAALAEPHGDERRVFAEGAPIEVAEEVGVRRDGERRILHTIRAPIFDEAGKVAEVVGVSRDVTDRRRAEREAQRQAALLSVAMESVPDGIVVIGPGGEILASNGRFAQMWGIQAEVLATGRVEAARAAILPQLADPEGFQSRVKEIYEGEPATTRDLLKLKDGRVFDRFSAPVPAPEGGLHGRIWSFRDVTDRKRAEETLSRLLLEVEEQRRRLDSIVASVPGVVWEAWGEPDASGQRINFVSEHVEKMLGYTREEWLSTPNFWLSIVHPEDAPQAAARAREAYESGVGATQQFRWRRKEGSYIWVQAWNVIVKDADGKPIGMRGVTMDVTALREAEAALRESDERFRLLARATNDTIWDWNLATNALWWNENFQALFGYEPSEIEPDITSWTSRLHPEDLPRVKAGILAAIEGADETWSDEYRFLCKNGEWAQIYDRGFIIRDAAGKATRMVGSMMEITARKRNEAALARLAAIVQNSEDAIYGKSPDGVITEWNPGAERLYGYTRAEIVGKPIQTVVPVDRVDEEQAILARVARGEPVPAFETVRIRKDGTRLDVSLTVSPIRDAEGRIVGASAIARDITERKRAHALLAWQRHVLEKIAAGVPLHETLDVLCREAEQQSPGHHFTVLLLDEEANRLRHGAAPGLPEHYNRAVDGIAVGEGVGSCGTAAFRREPVMVADIATDPLWKDFKALALPIGLRACWSTPIFGSDGRLLGTWAVYRQTPGDPAPQESAMVAVATRLASVAIERARSERELTMRARELAALAEQLQKSNRELDQFAYVTSHDLKAPLRGIANLSRWIEEDLGASVSAETREHLDLLRGRVNRMESLIDAILEYSRVGRVRQRAESVESAALIQDVVDLLAPPAGFQVVVDEKMPTFVTERARLQQVFMNLIGNAIKHHPDKAHGRVEVGVEDAGTHWRFSVKDNGQGIAPRFHEKVFVIFQTLEARDKVEGTGIGLALVKKIVEGYGGQISLESDVGKGATFRFTWPKQM